MLPRTTRRSVGRRSVGRRCVDRRSLGPRSFAPRSFGAALVLALALLATRAVALAEPVEVKATAARELLPAPGADAKHSYLAWTRSDDLERYHAALGTDGHGRALMDPPWALDTFTGSVTGGGVILQATQTRDSDLVRYDLATGETVRVSDRTSDPRWQWRPSASGRWMLFGEHRVDAPAAPWRVLLRDTATGEIRVLARSTSHCRCATPGQVNGDYAVWSAGPVGDVFRYTISTGEILQIPNPSGVRLHAPAVSADGTVYYVASGRGCGVRVDLVRYEPDGTVTTLFEMARNREPIATSVFDETDGSATLYFDRTRCLTGEADILAIGDADTASRVGLPRPRGTGGSPARRTAPPPVPGSTPA